VLVLYWLFKAALVFWLGIISILMSQDSMTPLPEFLREFQPFFLAFLRPCNGLIIT